MLNGSYANVIFIGACLHREGASTRSYHIRPLLFLLFFSFVIRSLRGGETKERWVVSKIALTLPDVCNFNRTFNALFFHSANDDDDGDRVTIQNI